MYFLGVEEEFGDKATIVVSKQMFCFFSLRPAVRQVVAACWASCSECTLMNMTIAFFLKQDLRTSLLQQQPARVQTENSQSAGGGDYVATRLYPNCESESQCCHWQRSGGQSCRKSWKTLKEIKTMNILTTNAEVKC